jgi:hypothetical protein
LNTVDVFSNTSVVIFKSALLQPSQFYGEGQKATA